MIDITVSWRLSNGVTDIPIYRDPSNFLPLTSYFLPLTSLLTPHSSFLIPFLNP
jgi:hypothetical protein